MNDEQEKKEISEVDAENWILRVKEEHKSLCEKIIKLEIFLDLITHGRIQNNINPAQYSLLMMQDEVMKIYRSILERRIELFEESERLKRQIQEVQK